MPLRSHLIGLLRRSPHLLKFIRILTGRDYIQKQLAALEHRLIYGHLSRLHQRLQILESGTPSQTPLVMIHEPHQTPPSLHRVVSQACTQEQLASEEFIQVCQEMFMTPNFHRKTWEYVYILQALRQAGVLGAGRRGLGFGVGKDRMVPLMVKAGCYILATDLDPTTANNAGWATTNQYAQKLGELDEFGVLSRKELAAKAKLRQVNMNDIPLDLQQGQFDFVWSACAFEHLGNIENGMRFITESFKCLRPGGVAVHTTEFNLSSNDHTIESGPTVLFRRKDLEEISRRLREMGGEIELNFHTGHLPMDLYYDVPPYSDFNHVKLLIDSYVVTSFGLVVKKR